MPTTMQEATAAIRRMFDSEGWKYDFDADELAFAISFRLEKQSCPISASASAVNPTDRTPLSASGSAPSPISRWPPTRNAGSPYANT